MNPMRTFLRCLLQRAWAAAAVGSCVISAGAQPAAPRSDAPRAAAPASAAAAGATARDLDSRQAGVSSTAQRIYEQTRGRLVQVRTLLRTQDSQSSVGSGFLVSDEGHLITNFHVVSDYALRPEQHRLVYAAADGQQGPLELLAVDVVHDLALLRPASRGALAKRGAVAFRRGGEPARGARVLALGNPLDVGFAVMEGSYNGLAERGFVPTLFFGGSLSAGMSGGPAVDDTGRLIGVNVAARRDGEQVSFLVPAAHAQALLQRARDAGPLAVPAYAEVTRQLRQHQDLLVKSFLAQPWRAAGHPRWRVPVPQETYLRCWGSGTGPEAPGMRMERSDCEMDSRLFVSDGLLTGYLTVRHEAYDGGPIGELRFAQRYSASFENEFFQNDNRWRTAARCTENTVQREGLPLRAVMCLSAYKRLAGLYDLSLLVATLDGREAGVQGRFDAFGVSFENAQALARHYLDGFAWIDPKNASR